MNKAEVKLLTEADNQLRWWAGSVLFAEISEIVMFQENKGFTVSEAYAQVVVRVKAFDKLVIQRAQDHAQEKLEKKLTLEERVAKLEESIGDKISAYTNQV